MKKPKEDAQEIAAKTPSRCTACGQFRWNLKTKTDTIGRIVYSVCSTCLINSNQKDAVSARLDCKLENVGKVR